MNDIQKEVLASEIDKVQEKLDSMRRDLQNYVEALELLKITTGTDILEKIGKGILKYENELKEMRKRNGIKEKED